MPRDFTKVRVGKTNAAILAGDLNLSTWSDEELVRGMRRDKNGRWGGRPPTVVPKAIHDEMVHRKMQKAHDLLRDNLVAAVQVFAEIATNKKVDPSVRLKAAEKIVERVLGKVPDRVHLAPDEQPAFVKAIQAGLIQLNGIVPSDQHSLPAGDDDDDS